MEKKMKRTKHNNGSNLPVKENFELAKRVLGRPTKYDPTVHPVVVVEAMSRGASKRELALLLGIAPITLYDWEKKHTDFSNSIKIGAELSEGWWLSQGRANIGNKDFNATLWMMNMSNRFGWSRKVNVDGKLDRTETVRSERTLSLKVDMPQDARERVTTLLELVREHAVVEGEVLEDTE